MKGILILLLLVALAQGCTSSYYDYERSCRAAYSDDFKYDDMCGYLSTEEALHNTFALVTQNEKYEPQPVPCERTNYTALKKFCLDKWNEEG